MARSFTTTEYLQNEQDEEDEKYNFRYAHYVWLARR
jgi:hypothetical protein